MSGGASLVCPKCRESMTSYERGGVIVDQCTGCRGVFLDRGELERLIDLEAGGVAQSSRPEYQGAPPDRSWRDRAPEPREWRSDDDQRGKRKSKRSLLGDLLDF